MHMDFAFYNVTSIQGFTSMLTIVYENTKILWVFTASPKMFPVRIISFILKTPKNKNTYAYM